MKTLIFILVIFLSVSCAPQSRFNQGGPALQVLIPFPSSNTKDKEMKKYNRKFKPHKNDQQMLSKAP